ncbi:unnamed protein product [Medioppia subpectinata]|uniref:Uncharacterized protein n=1 Tax=Medioppia subpectinata TaxID=1979941 RepID=A0A7R9PUW0_9ACAR|nr:unnamed protein product [Medioppia subpectinata]CAG2101953.1 unnamed protein product [Medioppia subpectinata]
MLQKGLFANVSRELKGRDTNYHQFYLSNKHVVEIPAAVFGDLHFNVITVENAVNLQRIHSQAFRGTEGTVETFSVINSPVAGSVANTADLFAAINSLKVLQYVNIYNTSLRNIPENAFNSLQHLHRIRVEYGIVEEISGNSFRNLPALKTLSLARNNLTHISDHALYDPSLTSGALSGLNVATIIDAEGNGFKHLDESVFGPFLRHPNNTQNDVIISTLDCTDCRNAWLTRGGSPAGRLFSAELPNSYSQFISISRQVLVTKTLYLKTRVNHPFIGLEEAVVAKEGVASARVAEAVVVVMGAEVDVEAVAAPDAVKVDVEAPDAMVAVIGTNHTSREVVAAVVAAVDTVAAVVVVVNGAEVVAMVASAPRGTAGRAIQLIVNHYRITGWEKMSCYLYDIDIRLPRRDGHGFVQMSAGPTGAAGGQPARRLRNERRADNTRVVAKMADEWPQAFADRLYAFDGQKYLYAGQELPAVSATPTTRPVVIQLDGFAEQTFEVRIQYVKRVLMAPLVDYFGGRNLRPNPEDFREALQALEVVLRYMPAQSLVPIYRNLYAIDGREPVTRGFRPPVPTNAEIAFGHYQSVHVTQTGITLNVDRTATLLVIGGPLITFIERELNITNLRGYRFTDDDRQRLNPKIKGLKIYTDHIPNQKRRFFIDSMVVQRVHEYRFDETDGQSVTVKEYFRSKYPNTGELLQNVGLIKTRNSKYLPVDVCVVYSDQPVPRRIVERTPEMTQQIVKSANSQQPSTRFGLIQQSAQEVEAVGRALMTSFGVHLEVKPIKLTGRQLPAPRLEGSQRQLKSCRPLTRYAFINYSVDGPLSTMKTLQECFNRFFAELVAKAQEMGINMADGPVAKASHRPTDEVVAADIAKFKDLDMIFICIPWSPVYKTIKHLADVVHGVPTQCIKDEHFLSPPRGYFGNLLLKVNAKNDGQNQVLAPPCRPSATLKKRAVMVVGVDVIHPGTGGAGDGPVFSSIAASVATFDAEFSKYHAAVEGQPLNTEIIATYDRMFARHLKTYKQKNNALPESVILFRDGVSDGQLDQVLAEEIRLIERAFDSIAKGFRFKLTVFVVQKRHHTRLMPLEPTFDAKGNELRNIPAGTVVDHTITHPLRNEFHLCSHTGRLGTSRHAKYICIRDDHKLTRDELQQISYNICHTYCRCATSISIPVPVAYADLLCTRAKIVIEAQNLPFQPRVRGESADEKRVREAANVQLLNANVEAHMKLILRPYYA